MVGGGRANPAKRVNRLAARSKLSSRLAPLPFEKLEQARRSLAPSVRAGPSTAPQKDVGCRCRLRQLRPVARRFAARAGDREPTRCGALRQA
jgi:hypothetical protein